MTAVTVREGQVGHRPGVGVPVGARGRVVTEGVRRGRLVVTVGEAGVGLAAGRADPSRDQDQDQGQESPDQGQDLGQGQGLDPGQSLDQDPNRVQGQNLDRGQNLDLVPSPNLAPNRARNPVQDVQSRGQDLDLRGRGQGPEDQARPIRVDRDQGLGREGQDLARAVQQGLRQAPEGQVLAPPHKTRLWPLQYS